MQNSNGTTRHRQVVENCFLFFYNNIDSLEVLSRKVSRTIRPGRKRKTNFSIITSFAWFVIDYCSSPISLPRSRFLGERCVTFKKRLRGRLFTNQSVEKMLCYYKNTNWKLLIQWSKQSFLGLLKTKGTFWSEALASSETLQFTGNCIFISSWWGDWKGARYFFISLFLFRSMYCIYPMYVGLKIGVLASKILNCIWQP